MSSNIDSVMFFLTICGTYTYFGKFVCFICLWTSVWVLSFLMSLNFRVWIFLTDLPFSTTNLSSPVSYCFTHPQLLISNMTFSTFRIFIWFLHVDFRLIFNCSCFLYFVYPLTTPFNIYNSYFKVSTNRLQHLSHLWTVFAVFAPNLWSLL